jgi:hypothetical protein
MKRLSKDQAILPQALKGNIINININISIIIHKDQVFLLVYDGYTGGFVVSFPYTRVVYPEFDHPLHFSPSVWGLVPVGGYKERVKEGGYDGSILHSCMKIEQ